MIPPYVRDVLNEREVEVVNILELNRAYGATTKEVAKETGHGRDSYSPRMVSLEKAGIVVRKMMGDKVEKRDGSTVWVFNGFE